MTWETLSVLGPAGLLVLGACWFGIKEYIASQVDLGKAQNQADAAKETNARIVRENASIEAIDRDSAANSDDALERLSKINQ